MTHLNERINIRTYCLKMYKVLTYLLSYLRSLKCILRKLNNIDKTCDLLTNLVPSAYPYYRISKYLRCIVANLGININFMRKRTLSTLSNKETKSKI